MKLSLLVLIAGISCAVLYGCEDEGPYYNREWSETLEAVFTEAPGMFLAFDAGQCATTFVDANGDAHDLYLATAFLAPHRNGDEQITAQPFGFQLGSNDSPTCFARLELVDTTEFTAEIVASPSTTNPYCTFTTGVEGDLTMHDSTVVDGRVRLDVTLDTVLEGHIVLNEGDLYFACEEPAK